MAKVNILYDWMAHTRFVYIDIFPSTTLNYTSSLSSGLDLWLASRTAHLFVARLGDLRTSHFTVHRVQLNDDCSVQY